MTNGGEAARRLTRYVPRLAAEWELDSDDRLWRELDATLCFVDISGFTNLAERLARFGRIGAEELTDVLNRVFGTMLDLAYQRGGTLLKFGGDALLLQFVETDHTAQAAAAAVEMRAALREAAQWTTSVGRLRLRMSVGIHSGPVHTFLVGRSHRELLVTGPAATAVTTAEHSADAGEIVVSAEAAARLPAGAIGKPKGAGHLLRWRRSPIPPVPPTHRREVAPDVIASRLPKRLRDHLEAGTRESEHRIATVGFVRYTGVDGLLARDGPDAVARALDELVIAVQEAADDEWVTFLASDVDSDGGKVIVTAGVPTAQEDDEGRVLRLLRRVVDHPSPLAVRAGVNRGHVFAGEVGSAHRATFTVMGDAVNLAARLMAAAPPGRLYAMPSVLEASRTRFLTEALEPLHVKGKTHPVQAYSVGAEASTRLGELEKADLPFTGRHDELWQLHEVLEAAHSSRGQVLTVVGDTGLGKSRLIEEAVAASGLQPFVVHGEPYNTSVPFGALREPVRSVLGVVRSDRATMADRLRRAVEVAVPHLSPLLPLVAAAAHLDADPTPEVDAIEPQYRTARLAAALEELLPAILAHPICIVVDDAQWIDEASAEVLQALAVATRHRPGAMIVARRPEEGGFSPADSPTLVLDPLRSDEAEAIVLAATDAAPLRPHEIDALVQRAGGNPLYLGEIIRFVHEVGSVEALPATLDAVVSAKIDALPALARRVVRYAAVLGRAFPRSIFEEFAALENLSIDDATWRELEGFFDSSVDEICFRHALIRDAAYESLPFRRRRELHRLAATAIEQVASANPEVAASFLALHYTLSGDDEQGWHWSLLAADQARAAYANIEAAHHYERALESARRLTHLAADELVETWRNLGDVREFAGLFESAFDAYRQAYRLENDPVARATLHERRARARERSGAFTVALREATLGLRLLESTDIDLTDEAAAVRANLIAFAAIVRQAQQRPREAMKLAEQALDAARIADERRAEARVLQVLDWANLVLGRPVARRDSELALALYRELGDLAGQASILNNLGVYAYFDGEWDQAASLYEQSRRAFAQAGNVVESMRTAANIGEILVNQGRYAEAKPLLEEAARVQRVSGYIDGAVFAELQLGRIHLVRDELDDAERVFATAWAEYTELGEQTSALEAAIHLADCQLRRGDAARAVEMLDLAADAVEDSALFAASMARVRATALIALGRVEEASASIALGIESARQQEQPYDLAMLVITSSDLARQSGKEPDQRAVAEASEVLERLGVRNAMLGAIGAG